MNVTTLAQEIIHGRRLGRQDDLSFFLTCDLDELCRGADAIRAELTEKGYVVEDTPKGPKVSRAK